MTSVVICDDNSSIRHMLGLLLEREEDLVVVGEAANGREAIERCSSLRPDVLVLDLNMPVMNGLEALPLIASNSPETRIVVLSGFAASSVAEEALRRGAVAYVEKGHTFDQVADSIRAAMQCSPKCCGGAESPSERGPGETPLQRPRRDP